MRSCNIFKAERHSHVHQVGKRSRFHLLHDLPSMCLHRFLTDAKFPTDLLIQQAGDDQRHDLPFTTSKRRITVPYHLHPLLQAKSYATAFEGLPDGAQQHFFAEWFCQTFDRASLHGLDGHTHIEQTGNKDDRHVCPFDSYTLLEVETVQARQRNVKYEAARNKRSRTGEKFFSGRKCCRLPAFAASPNVRRAR